MAKANNRNRVVLQLDPRIALEAIILTRLDRIPKTRRQEWLRGLLVQGFRIECQVQKEASVATRSEGGMRFSDWLTADSKRQATLPKPKREQKATVPLETPATHSVTKPFAQLSGVIG